MKNIDFIEEFVSTFSVKCSFHFVTAKFSTHETFKLLWMQNLNPAKYNFLVYQPEISVISKMFTLKILTRIDLVNPKM